MLPGEVNIAVLTRAWHDFLDHVGSHSVGLLGPELSFLKLDQCSTNSPQHSVTLSDPIPCALAFYILQTIMFSPNGQSNGQAEHIPKVQTVALVKDFGGEVIFKDDYPVPTPKNNEVLAKVLYSGVCQSGM